MAHIRKQTRPMKLNATPTSTAPSPPCQASSSSLQSPTTSSAPTCTAPSPPRQASSSSLSILRQALIMSCIVPKQDLTHTSPSSPSPRSRSSSSSSSSGSSSSSSSSRSSSSSSSRPCTPSTPSASVHPSSPTNYRPSVICINNESPSEKFNQLKALRRQSILPAPQCSYNFKKGARKGERCAKSCVLNEKVCRYHLKQNHKGTVSLSTPHPTVKPTKIRINRLRKNKRYFFVKSKGFAKVVVQCEGKLYYVELPRAMDLHVEELTKEDYLIRNDSGSTVWKTLK